MKELVEYLKSKRIKFKVNSDYVVEMRGFTYELIEPVEGKIFDNSFEMTCEDTEEDNYVFKFGGNWYWTPEGSELNCELNPLINIGEINVEPPYISNLGIHGKYEVLNGSATYDKWCEKGKFLKCESLGICEKNSLAGCLQFQNECDKHKIKSIQGLSVVLANEKKDFRFLVKMYARNDRGWQTLLKASYIANVVNNGYITLEDLKELDTVNTYLIVDPKECVFEEINFDFDFYQLDTVEYSNNETDKNYLKNLKKFANSKYQPILIQDSYYLEQEDWELKQCINKVGNKEGKISKNQHFKYFDEIVEELDSICKKEELFENLLGDALDNLNEVVENCNFRIETGNRHLPKYPMTPEEIDKYETVENMFYTLLEEGIKAKAPKGEEDKYIERISREVEVIEFGNVIDYFLETRDYVNWAKENDILVGTGRGSSAGAVTSYVLDIVQTNPFDYDLLFERFLTKGRVGKYIDDEKVVLNDGKLSFWKNEKLWIKRNGKEIEVMAKDLIENDEI